MNRAAENYGKGVYATMLAPLAVGIGAPLAIYGGATAAPAVGAALTNPATYGRLAAGVAGDVVSNSILEKTTGRT